MVVNGGSLCSRLQLVIVRVRIAIPEVFSNGVVNQVCLLRDHGDRLAQRFELDRADIVSIDLRGKTSIADMMLVASGRSTVHVGAIADRVIKACKEAGLASPRVEGIPNCDWVLIDAHDVIVHVFRPEVRQFYNLEKMWSGDRPAERGARSSA